jgi:sugar (pentulose or hexulose) kinase
MSKINTSSTYLGIEFGSTRIKAVLIDDTFAPVASGAYDWENRLENGYWTYSLDDVTKGLRGAYASLAADFEEKFGESLTTVGAMGISAMMHGYLPFDSENRLLAPFRTWRNTTTAEAAAKLTKLFGFNVPQRWSIAHLYQAMLNKEEHVKNIAYITTLAGYVHFLLTGKRVVGVGEAAGMFPLGENGKYDEKMLDSFSELSGEYDWNIRSVLPEIMTAGENAGTLTESGAALLDLTGKLKAGIPLCPPEGDAGTGMAATNSVLPRTGNVSAGTSIFSMLVLEKPLSGVYPEIDVVATPDGKPVAMVHCNNCCSELDAWVKLFGEFAELSGRQMSKSELYELLYKNALNGDPDCGGVMAYNFLSGEPVAGAENGRPMYYRSPNGRFSLANFMRAELYSAFGALKLGMDILSEKENVPSDKFTGHGGLFKVSGVAQQFLSDALGADVSVMKNAGEGGAWGMALLAAYMSCGEGKTLPEWLDTNVFTDLECATLSPTEQGSAGFAEFMKEYRRGLKAEYAAAE